MKSLDVLNLRESVEIKAQLDEITVDRGSFDDETPDWVARSPRAWSKTWRARRAGDGRRPRGAE